MKMKAFVSVTLLSFVASGCISLYRYESTGTVTAASGDSSNAVIYWHANEGGLWGKKGEEMLASGVVMRVCEGIPKEFVPKSDEQTQLLIRSEPGDRQTAEINSNGDVVILPQPEILRDSKGKCGQVEVLGQQATIEKLTVGVEPAVVILCDNIDSEDSFPKAKRYVFKAVTRAKVEEERDPGDVCTLQ